MKIFEIIEPYEYIGDCRSTVDVDNMWDTTEMAQIIENSQQVPVKSILPFIPREFREQVMAHPNQFEAGKYQNLIWLYDVNTDIHHFFEK